MECATCSIYYFIVRLVAYFVILALLFIMTFIALKILGEWKERLGDEEERGENSPLMPNKTVPISYGTCPNDLDFKTSSDNNASSSSNIASTLYDEKICIICYDEQMNCFLVPCGHCATCFSCAQRIFYEEKRTCPVCRRYIGKITRLFNS